MDGTPLVLSRTLVTAVFVVGAAVSTQALAGPETPSFREQAACHKHREAGEHVQAHLSERILVRDLDNGSPYDFQRRGSGISAALAEHYVEVRRIPGVE